MRSLDIIRSLLFVPPNSPAKLAKAKKVPADAIILDWEDAVGPDQKPAARVMTSNFLLDCANRSRPVLIRLNPFESSFCSDDLAGLENCLPDGVVLAKCQSVAHVECLDAALARYDPNGDCRVVPMVESAQALLQCHAIANCSPRVVAMAFGAEDFCADVGITRTADELELLYARCALVTASRAAGRSAIDSPCLEFRDTEKVRSAARRARNLGFAGKLAIHPAQVTVLNEAFSPSESEINDARELLAVFSSNSGGVTASGDRMVDKAVVRRARQILRLADQIDS